MAVFAGGSAAIKKAHIAKATSDLHNFQIAVEMTLNESPQVANIAAPTKKAQLEGIMDALNGNLAADYKLTAVDGTLTGNITKTAATTDDASFIICRSDKTDSWGNPYFVIIDRAERGGSAASEFYMTTVTAGPNAILHLDGAIDGDDIFSLTSYADGDVISATYNMAEAAPTIVGGAEAATSYTAVMTAPVNNGVTVGGYVAPETPAQDPQQGGGNEPAAKQTPDVPTLSATSGSVTAGNTTSFTVSRQGTGAVSAVSANESVATVSVSSTTVTVTGVAAGTTTISVSVGEDSTYLVSESVLYEVEVLPAPEIISFTIQNAADKPSRYQAESGMTWLDWVGSEYNACNASVGTWVQVGLMLLGGTELSSYVYASPDELIIDGYAYHLQGSGADN